MERGAFHHAFFGVIALATGLVLAVALGTWRKAAP